MEAGVSQACYRRNRLVDDEYISEGTLLAWQIVKLGKWNPKYGIDIYTFITLAVDRRIQTRLLRNYNHQKVVRNETDYLALHNVTDESPTILDVAAKDTTIPEHDKRDARIIQTLSAGGSLATGIGKSRKAYAIYRERKKRLQNEYRQ